MGYVLLVLAMIPGITALVSIMALITCLLLARGAGIPLHRVLTSEAAEQNRYAFAARRWGVAYLISAGLATIVSLVIGTLR